MSFGFVVAHLFLKFVDFICEVEMLLLLVIKGVPQMGVLLLYLSKVGLYYRQLLLYVNHFVIQFDIF
jgi:hypothetical protein